METKRQVLHPELKLFHEALSGPFDQQKQPNHNHLIIMML